MMGFINFLSDLSEAPVKLNVYIKLIETVFFPITKNTIGVCLVFLHIPSPVWLQSYLFVGMVVNLTISSGVLSTSFLPIKDRIITLARKMHWYHPIIVVGIAPWILLFILVAGVILVVDTLM